MENQIVYQPGFQPLGKDKGLDMHIFYEKLTGKMYAQKAKDIYIELDELIKAREKVEAQK